MSVVFVTPTPGREQIAPAPMPPNATAPTTWVDAGSLRAWTRVEAAADAFRAVNDQIDTYLNNTFATWYTAYSGGHLAGPTGIMADPNAVPPSPPAGAMAELDVTGLDWDLVQTGPPVMSRVPPYTKIPAPQSRTGGNALADLQAELAKSPAPFIVVATAPTSGQSVSVTATDGTKWALVRIG